MSYHFHAGGLAVKKAHEIHPDIRKGITAVSRIAKIHSTNIVGTSRYKRMFFGDVDLFSPMNPETVGNFVKQIQTIVKKLPKDMWFSDFKAGGTKTRGFHFTKRQLLAGKRGGRSLEDHLMDKAITKLDIIVPLKTKFGTRLIEMTNFFWWDGISAPFGSFIQEMNKDIAKYGKTNRKLKVVKRTLSKLLYTDYKRDQKEINRLASIVRGPAGKLGSILADAEVCRLLVKNKALQKQQLAYMSKMFGEKISMRNLKRVEKDISSQINGLI